VDPEVSMAGNEHFSSFLVKLDHGVPLPHNRLFDNALVLFGAYLGGRAWGSSPDSSSGGDKDGQKNWGSNGNQDFGKDILVSNLNLMYIVVV